MNRTKRLVIGFVIFDLLIALFVAWYFLLAPVSDAGGIISIKQGSPLAEIATQLKEKKLIRSTTLFEMYARLRGLDREIKAGRFSIKPDASPVEIVNFLSNPGEGELSLTIPEGYSIRDIDEKLVELEISGKEAFRQATSAFQRDDFSFLYSLPSLEGFLFPDTYFVFANEFDANDLIGKMIGNFEKKWESLSGDFKNQKRGMYDVVIMASLIEEEVRNEKDMRIVSGILWKRLDNEWPLQVDATLLYSKEDRKITHQG